jgi:hypothetical protein
MAPVNPLRRTAIVAGLLYFVTHITSVPTLLLYKQILTDPSWVLGSGPDAPVLFSALLEVICAMAIVGTAVTLFPVVRRTNEGVALGYVGLRTLEASIICMGIVAVLGVVTLRQHLGTTGTDAVALTGLAAGLVAVHNWTFLFGPNFVLGVNTVLMAYLMYRSRLVPRFIAVLGLIGGPIIFASAIAELFGVYDQVSAVGGLTALPVFAWEICLAGWLVFKGFNTYAVDRAGADSRASAASASASWTTTGDSGSASVSGSLARRDPLITER